MLETILAITFCLVVFLVASGPGSGRKKGEVSDMEKARGRLKDESGG